MKRDNDIAGVNEGDFSAAGREISADVSEDQISRAIPPRFDVSAAEIDKVVQIFYATIRRHDVLGPIFSRHVTDWPSHEAKIAGFWKKAILHQPGYDGNPMQVHLAAGNVQPTHFGIWLKLFDETLHSAVSPASATAWSALAHRIGRGLRMACEDRCNKPDAPPVLR